MITSQTDHGYIPYGQKPGTSAPNVVNIDDLRDRRAGLGAQSTSAKVGVGPQITMSSYAEDDNVSAGPRAEEFTEQSNDKVDQMNMSKDELDAKLGRNKAEVEAISSSMQKEMANFRTSYTESFRDISILLNKIDAKADATEKRLTQAQWVIALVISICAVTLSAVIFFSNKSNKQPSQQPDIVINTSQTPPQPTDLNKELLKDNNKMQK